MKGARSRWFMSGALALIMLLLGAASWGQTPPWGHASGTQAGFHLAMDADPVNGTRPCDPVDASATAAVGSTYTVALCLGGYTANDVESFELSINNDQTLSSAPDPQGDEEPQNGGSGPDCGKCLDDNPDVNDGDDPAGFKLGGGWDCTGFGFAPPRSQTLPIHMVCNADIVSPDKDLSANPGLLATITFQALTAGSDTLSFASNTAIGMSTSQDGSCGDVATDIIDCFGATINIGGVAAPTSTPSSIATPTSTPSATGPGVTPTPLPPGMEAVDLVAGCNPVASTYPDATAVQTIAGNVGPAAILDALWEFEMGTWLGYSPQFPEVSDLREKDFLDVVFVCVSAPGVFVRPAV